MIATVRISLAILLGVLATFTASCRNEESAIKPARQAGSTKKWDRGKADLEYRLIQAETRLAKTEKPYLVLDMKNREIVIKLKGALVWSYPMEIDDANSEQTDDFVRRFRGNQMRLIRPMTEKHLFAASDKTPDSILAIVGEAVNVDPDLLQREVPQRFMISWSPSLSLEIRTDAAGKPTSRFKNTFVEFRQALSLPFGVARIVIKMNPDDALTLYRASRPGLPTLIYPAF
ncbi:MAG: hypothetical protein A2W25_03370 [candidate division Zixibacteria bacterium RBG_16_53_22]|nr:MAG: hypothetical protein A2W25_03370 [candidate division Zixibacteria bacterium RBG_16_53_22]